MDAAAKGKTSTQSSCVSNNGGSERAKGEHGAQACIEQIRSPAASGDKRVESPPLLLADCSNRISERSSPGVLVLVPYRCNSTDVDLITRLVRD